MFIGLQKLGLFSEHKSPELRQFLNLAELQPLGYNELARSGGFDANFLANSSFDRQQPDLKVPILTLLETSPTWLRNG
jgi:hypothetical protein